MLAQAGETIVKSLLGTAVHPLNWSFGFPGCAKVCSSAASAFRGLCDPTEPWCL